MPQIEIREIYGEDRIRLTHPISRYAFNSSPPLTNLEEELRVKKDFIQFLRAFMLFEDGHPMTCLYDIRMNQNIRGKVFPMSGVATVASYPEARRKGYVRRLFGHLFEQLQDANVPCSTPYAFRPSFYERLGYASMYPLCEYVLDSSDLAYLLKSKTRGTIKRCSFKDGYELYKEFLHRYRLNTHGFGCADNLYPETNSIPRNDKWLALAMLDGQCEGFMIYSLNGKNATMHISMINFTSPEVECLLLNYIARHIDQIKRVTVFVPNHVNIQYWIRDEAPLEANYLNGPMGRIIHLAELEGMDVGAGEIHIQLTDPACPWQEGNYTLASENGKLKVKAKVASSEISLPIQALSALVYGVMDPAYFPWKGYPQLTSTQRERLLALFPLRMPFLQTRF